MRNRWLPWPIAAAVILALSGCSSGGTTNEKVDATFIQVPELYKQNCLSCHGDQLQGRVGPGLQNVGERLTKEEIARLITNGKGGMPSFASRLQEENIESLADWLSGL